jgi:hypothetical protein
MKSGFLENIFQTFLCLPLEKLINKKYFSVKKNWFGF